jgi:hypothetical protein
MSHARLRLFVGVLALGALAASAPVEASNTQVRPMAGVCSTTFSVQPAGEIAIDGICQLTHLGTAEYHATQTVTPNPDGTVHITVTGFYTAANGDILRSTVVGTGRFTGPSTVMFTTTETFVGGTGRFASATGVTNDSGAASFTGPTTGVSTYSSDGSISY